MRNLRRGRAQQMLSGATAAAALPLGVEIYVNHYGGSFGNKWMWSPVVLTPAARGGGGRRGPLRARRPHLAAVLLRAAACRTGSPASTSTVAGSRASRAACGEASYNLVMGPPLLAPGSLTMVGGIGLAAAVMRREKW